MDTFGRMKMPHHLNIIVWWSGRCLSCIIQCSILPLQCKFCCPRLLKTKEMHGYSKLWRTGNGAVSPALAIRQVARLPPTCVPAAIAKVVRIEISTFENRAYKKVLVLSLVQWSSRVGLQQLRATCRDGVGISVSAHRSTIVLTIISRLSQNSRVKIRWWSHKKT
jgi:hypothetical protein